MPPFDGARAPTAPTASTGTAAPPPAGAVAVTRVKVAVTSPHPTEVSLDLRPRLTARRLVVQSLRTVEPDKPRLTDVAIEDTGPDEPLTLRIRVPAEQPPGVYNGLIVDEDTSGPVGTVSVRITVA